MPCFSIITCCYNLEKYINEAYLSLAGQTFTDWEWIIVDDESQDKTKEIIKSWDDERVVLIESEHLGNLSALRNRGIEKAKGNFIAVLDGDDLWEQDMLLSFVTYFNDNPNADWCSTNAKVFIDGTNLLEQNKMPNVKGGTYKSDDALRILLRCNFIYVSATCFRAQIIRDAYGFNEAFDRCEDIELWLRLSKLGYTMGYIEIPLLHYRIRNNSLYRIKELEYLNTNFRVYESLLTENKELQSKYKKEIKEYLSQNHFRIGIVKYYNQERDCTSSFLKALKINFSIEKLIWFLISTIPYTLRTMLKNKITTFKTLKLVFNIKDFLRLLKQKAFWFMYKSNKDYAQKTVFLSDIKSKNYNLSPVNMEGLEALKLSLPKFDLFLRKNTSDLFVYNQVFIEKEYYSLIQLITQLSYTNGLEIKNIVDVGANIGFFTLFMSEYYPDASFVLIEPDKSNADCISVNTKSITQ